jgi:hypothetical protein
MARKANMLKLYILIDDSRVKETAAKYWQYDPATKNFPIAVTKIAKELGIQPHKITEWVLEACLAYDDEFLCSNCQKPIYFFNSRTRYTEHLRDIKRGYIKQQPDQICRVCRREMDRAEKEKTSRIQLSEDQKKIRILSKFKDKRPAIDLQDLTLEQAVFLDAYGRIGLAENYEVLRSVETVSTTDQVFTPSGKYDYEVVNGLYQRGFLQIHPQNNPDIISDLEEEKFKFQPWKTNWYFPVCRTNPEDLASLFKQIEQAFQNSTWPDPWKGAILPLWRKIAMWECLEYLDFVLKEHKFELNPGPKTLNLFETLLTKYSTGQIFNWIWRAGRDAAAFYVREGVTKQHAANTVVGTIQRMAERAEAENWDVKPFRRNYQLPQSMVSQVLYNAVLKIGEAGFNTCPISL